MGYVDHTLPGHLVLVEFPLILPSAAWKCRIYWIGQDITKKNKNKNKNKKKNTKNWMNFFANPIPHWPTGCYQVLLGATGSVEQRVLPRSCFFLWYSASGATTPSRHWTWHTFCLLESQETLGLVLLLRQVGGQILGSCIFPQVLQSPGKSLFSF